MKTSGFISKAACRGYRPSRFASYAGRQRPHLIARLAKDRSIARFIVAPSGYGKTSLAVDYAETMFSWTHVFWLNAQSPCFIRDLDSGVIASSCRAVDSETRLVVIDDLPQLDSARVKGLSREIDALLAHGSEVIVACTPSCDLLGGLQMDRFRLGAEELLLSDEEVDASRADEERLRRDAAQVPAACRVPALVWDAQPASAAAFVAGNMQEGLPSDLLLAICSAFALRDGSISDLAAIGPIDVQLVSDGLADYPHLGFDVGSGWFEAPLVDADLLARAVKRKMGVLAERSRFDSADDMVEAWAGILLERSSSADRACDLVRAFCPVRRRARWLLDHARQLARHGCFYAMERIAASVKEGGYEGKDRMLAIEALCLRMLGDEDGALRCAKRCAYQAGLSRDARVIGLLVVARLGAGEARASAAAVLSSWAAALPAGSYGGAPWHDALAAAWDARQGGLETLGETWAAMRDAGADDDALCLAASWLFALATEELGGDIALAGDVLAPVERYVRALFSGDGPAPGFFATSAALSMEEAHSKGMPYADGPLEANVLLDLRRAEVAVLRQRRAYENDRAEERVRRANLLPEGSLYGADRARVRPVEQRAVPTLEVKVFGRLDVSIGGVPVEPSRIGRRQTRALLVLLIANRGRDISRDAAARTMWPARDIAGARKNFYTTWSQLRRALTLPDGTCPYLVRHQFGCRLDDRNVRSDMARFEDICRELLFGRVDFDAWIDIYNEVDRDYSGDLLPVEEGNPLLDKIRVDCRNRLVDSLIAASLRLVEAENPQWAVWYARAAIDRDRTREDAYVALMRAQIAHDQRTAAMMTYHDCRNVLSDELGIDPSPEMTALYESLLDA